jgi:hypothetical protein
VDVPSVAEDLKMAALLAGAVPQTRIPDEWYNNGAAIQEVGG